MSVDAPERIWVYHNGNSQTYLTAPNKFHNIEYVLADKLEELAAKSGKLHDYVNMRDMQIADLTMRTHKAEAALATAKRENEALRGDLQRAVEIVREHVPYIPPDGPSSLEQNAAYEAVGFALHALERHVRARNAGCNPTYQEHPTGQERLYRNTEPLDGFVEDGIVPVDVWGPPMDGGKIFTIRAARNAGGNDAE